MGDGGSGIGDLPHWNEMCALTPALRLCGFAALRLCGFAALRLCGFACAHPGFTAKSEQGQRDQQAEVAVRGGASFERPANGDYALAQAKQPIAARCKGNGRGF